MTRILLSAPHDRPFTVGQYLLKALRSLKHEVEIFNFREAQDLSAELDECVQSHRPEVHILFQGERFQPADIEALKKRGIYTILWNHDVHADLPDWLLELARCHDFYFNIARGMIPQYQARGIEHCAWLSEGFDPDAYRYDTISAEERRDYETDAVIVGNINRFSSYRVRREMLRHLIANGMSVRWWGPRTPHKLKNLPFMLSRVARAWGGRYIWNEDYAKVVACSKIFVARDINPEIDGSVSNRIYAALGCGAFYLTWYSQGIEDLFVIDEEIVVFHDLDEMVEKARYYLDHPDERQAIAEAGRKRVLLNYTWEDRFREMFEMVHERSGVTV